MNARGKTRRLLTQISCFSEVAIVPSFLYILLEISCTKSIEM